MGAGQDDYDRDPDINSRYRFKESQGADVWTKWQFGLLPDTDQKHAATDANLRTAVAGSRLYYAHGTVLDFITDVTVDTPSRTAVTGHPANASTAIASDGFNVWTAHGSQGVYKTTRTTGSMASHITGTVSRLGYVRNRVIAANAASLYDVTALAMGGGGALPAALFTHPNVDFSWVDFAELNGFIYAAGFSGDKSLIYKIGITDEATSLGSPVAAAALPDGEVVTHINGYLGNFLFIGTTKGYRLAASVGDGELRLGALITTPNPVLASEPQEEFIWYGLGNFSATHSGLGRLSTNNFTDLDRLVPAYASDLMVEETANITSIVTFQGLRVFTVEQVGLYAQHATNLVPEAYIDTGRVTYGMTEPKIGIWFDVQHSEEAGSHEVLVSYDGTAFQSIGLHDGSEAVHAEVTHFLGIVAAAAFEFRLVLRRDTVDPTKGLTFRSWLFRSQPTAEPTDYIYATILIADVIDDVNGVPQVMNPYEEKQFLTDLRRSRSLAKWQQGSISHNVFLEDFELDYKSLMDDSQGFTDYNGSCLLKMKVVN
jgi:hypothetical protein